MALRRSNRILAQVQVQDNEPVFADPRRQAKIDQLEGRIDGQDARFESQDDRFLFLERENAELKERNAGLEERHAGLVEEFARLREQFDSHVEGLENKAPKRGFRNRLQPGSKKVQALAQETKKAAAKRKR